MRLVGRKSTSVTIKDHKKAVPVPVALATAADSVLAIIVSSAEMQDIRQPEETLYWLRVGIASRLRDILKE